MQQHKPVIAIHDISGFGRCSLSVIMPTLSVMGLQCCPVPTSVFSTHTGGLGTVVKRDLTDFLAPTLAHYLELGLQFGGVYTGYLSSQEQVDHCLQYFEAFPNALHIVDPVMGDHGKIYRAITEEMQKRMKELVAKAELITPNLTEAYRLLDKAYTDAPLTPSSTKQLLAALCALGPRYAIVTGIAMVGSTDIFNVGMDKQTGAVVLVSVARVPASYPGTGDLFAAIITGEMVKGAGLEEAMRVATAFTRLAVSATYEAQTDTRFGVLVEPLLYHLATGLDTSMVQCENL